MTALFEAIRAGDLARVTELLDGDPALVRARRADGQTPALLACYHRVPAVLGLLRARGAVLDVFEAAAAGDVTRLAALLGEAPGLVSAHAGDGWTPLHLAAHFGETPAVALLLAHGGDPRARSRNPLANTPLHAGLAGTAGLDLVDRLLSAGAEVNAVDGGGFTPLHLAASRGELSLVTRLLLRGAETSMRTAEGRTPADLARARGHEPTARFLETWWGERARIVARRVRQLSPWTTLIEKDVEFVPGRAPDTYHAFGPFDWVVAVARTPRRARRGRPAVPAGGRAVHVGAALGPDRSGRGSGDRVPPGAPGGDGPPGRARHLPRRVPSRHGPPRARPARLPRRGIRTPAGVRPGARGRRRLRPSRGDPRAHPRRAAFCQLHHIAAWFLADPESRLRR